MRILKALLAFALLVTVNGAIGTPTARAQSSAARPPFRYGMVVSNSSNDSKVAALGFGWVKLFVSWNSIEGTKGTFSNYPDTAVQQAHDNNLQILMLVFDTPAWANGTGSYNPNSPPPANPSDLGDFMAHLAAHYAGQVDAYEIWNEENVADTWGGQFPNAVTYTNMLKAVYPAVKQADPNALVISGGVANTGDGSSTSIGDLTYLQTMLQNGAGNYLDAIGIHPYPGACAPTATSCPQTPGTYFRRAEQEHDTVVQYGGANIPLWITEAGYFSVPSNLGSQFASCDNSPGIGGFTAYEVSEQTKANDIVAAYQYAYDNWPWLGMFMLMNLDISMDSTSDRALCDPARFWAILDQNGNPTPAYTALQQMVKYTPQVTISQSSSFSSATGTIQISGSLTDPAATSGVSIDDVVVSVGAPYSATSTLAPVTFQPNGTFTANVDVTQLPAYQSQLVYVYVHSPTDGWTSATVGITPTPQVTVAPESVVVWIDPTQSTTATVNVAVGRNDSNSQSYYWSSTVSSSNSSWLSVPMDANTSPNTSNDLVVSVNAASLSDGVYHASITLQGDSSDQSYFQNLPVTIPVTLFVGPLHQIFIPSVPDGFPSGL